MFMLDKTVLVLVDVQGKLARMMHDREFFFKSLEILIQGVKILGVPVIWVEHNPEGLGGTVPEIARHLEGMESVKKTSFSCCGNDGFMEALRSSGRNQVLVAGMEAHICILLTALDLLEGGYEVQVVADGISSRSPKNRENAIQRMGDAGVVITNVETALYEMMRVAEFPRFKEVLRLIK